MGSFLGLSVFACAIPQYLYAFISCFSVLVWCDFGKYRKQETAIKKLYT